MIENSPGEIAFKSARAYGSGSTTSGLRFVFPYERIPQGTKVALIGAGIIGRHYYSQIMLSGYCDIVCWVETENQGGLSYISDYSALDNKKYDYAVIAYENPALLNNAKKYLYDIGINKEKIINTRGEK